MTIWFPPSPDCWEVFPFDEAVRDATGGNPKVKESEALEHGLLPVIDQGKEYIRGYVDDPRLQCRVPLPIVLFGDHTKIIKYITDPFVLGADGVKILKPRAGWDEKFIYHYLKTIRLPNGEGYSRHFKFLKRISVPRPPLDEQRRIAAILDKADAIRRKHEQALALADDFLRSTFLHMFGDPVTNPRRLPTAPIKELGAVMTGNTPSRQVTGYYGNAIEWIKSDNINTPSHFLTQAEEGLSYLGKSVARVVPAGSTLVTCIAGSPSCIGNAAMTDREVAFNQQINAVVPNSKTDPLFLYAQFLVGRKLVQQASTNSMKGMVSKGKFQEIMFLNPPPEQQTHFGRLFRKCAVQLQRTEEAGKDAANLFESLSQRAFRGEL